jgi:hypothetical protein
MTIAGRLQLLAAKGASPFVSLRCYATETGDRFAIESRAHRKGLRGGQLEGSTRRSAAAMNTWIGVFFAIGAALFALGCLLLLLPSLADSWSLSTQQVNLVFFCGSVPFTLAALLQLLQAELAGDFHNFGMRSGLSWRLHNTGWLACLLQFIGTLLFNASTWEAMYPGATWLQQDLDNWLPDIAGSILFLASGYLAFVETCHQYGAWLPENYSWWITSINLLGCIAFMGSACLALYLPHQLPPGFTDLSVFLTLVGALAFFVGAVMLPWEK